jgi:hypothetical protein
MTQPQAIFVWIGAPAKDTLFAVDHVDQRDPPQRYPSGCGAVDFFAARI